MKELPELLEQLNLSDETDFIEAKKASEVGKSIMETGTLDTKLDSLPTNLDSLPTKLNTLPAKKQEQLKIIMERIAQLPQRVNDKSQIEKIVLELCSLETLKMNELADLISRNEKYLYQEFVKPLLQSKKLNYEYPEMINHPEQAYKTNKKFDV